jgi:sorbose reductase
MVAAQLPQKTLDYSSHVLNQFSLKGKVAAVTGGSRGIGLEIVRGLAEAGADVALIYRTTVDAPQKAAKIASQNGVRIKAYKADVTARESIANVIETVAQEFGHLDIVVVNAGVCSNVKSLEYTEESWHHINSVNIDGAMWTAQAAGKVFKAQGRGNLVITASVSSVLVNYPQEQAAYNASKAAVAHLGKCLAVEWAAFARVNMVSPGYISTESTFNQNTCRNTDKDQISSFLSLLIG